MRDGAAAIGAGGKACVSLRAALGARALVSTSTSGRGIWGRGMEGDELRRAGRAGCAKEKSPRRARVLWNCSKVAGTSYPRRRGVELFPGAGDFERGDELVEFRPQFSIVGLRFDRRQEGGGGIVEKSALQVDGVVRRGGCAGQSRGQRGRCGDTADAALRDDVQGRRLAAGRARDGSLVLAVNLEFDARRREVDAEHAAGRGAATMVARSGWSAFVVVRVRTHLTRSAPLLNQQSTGKSLTVRAVSAGASVMSTGRAASWLLVPPVLVSPA